MLQCGDKNHIHVNVPVKVYKKPTFKWHGILPKDKAWDVVKVDEDDGYFTFHLEATGS